MSGLSGMYRSECANCKALRARVAELEGQHKGLVIQNAILRSRPDLPADRIPAADRVAKLEDDRNSWKAIAEKRHDILLGVEWSGEVEAEAQSEGCCPYCLAYSDRKHEVGCKMAEAIAESARAANGEVRSE